MSLAKPVFCGCPYLPLGMDDLVHLSRMSMLTHLEFAVGRTLPDPDSPLSLLAVLPRKELASFFTSVLTSGAGHTIKKLSLIQMDPQSDHVRSEALLLGLEDSRS